MEGWYFSRANCRLGYGDGRLIEAGITHKHEGDIALCTSGLHFSRNILDALKYAPWHVIWRVECSGKMLHDCDKSVCTERHYLWGYDASDVLRRFARLCALDVIHLWNAPPVVVEYLTTGEEAKLDAAWAAAKAEARNSAEALAWAVARAAARDATRGVAWAAARYAARDAAWAAELAASRAAARDAARDAAWAAALAASRAAARDAARKKQARRLASMVVRNRPVEAT